MAKKGSGFGKHAAPFLKKALAAAAKSYKRTRPMPNKALIKKLQVQRDALNRKIKAEKRKQYV